MRSRRVPRRIWFEGGIHLARPVPDGRGGARQLNKPLCPPPHRTRAASNLVCRECMKRGPGAVLDEYPRVAS